MLSFTIMYTGGRVVMKWWRSGGEEEVLRR